MWSWVVYECECIPVGRVRKMDHDVSDGDAGCGGRHLDLSHSSTASEQTLLLGRQWQQCSSHRRWKKHPVLRPIIWGLTLPIRSYKSLSFIGRSRPKCLPNHSSFCVQFKWCSRGPVELNPAASYIHVWDVFEGNYVHFSRAKLGLCLLKGFDVVYVLNDVFCVCVSTGSTVVLTS